MTFFYGLSQYPMDQNKGLKVPVAIRVNMWLGLSAHEKKFNSFSEGTFSVFAELVGMVTVGAEKDFPSIRSSWLLFYRHIICILLSAT